MAEKEMAKGAKPSDASKNIARVKITPASSKQTAEFKGRVFTSEGEDFSGSAEDLAAIDGDPNFVVERFDKNGALLKRTGEPYQGVPAPKPIRRHKDDED